MISFGDFYSKLLRRLNSNSFLLKWKISKEIISSFFENEKTREDIKKIINKNTFKSEEILALLKAAMEKISGLSYNNCKESLKSIYEYTLTKNFEISPSKNLSFEEKASFEFFLRVYRIFWEFQKLMDSDIFESRYPLIFLSPLEESELENKEEYRRFVKAFNHNYVYEMMELSKDVSGFNTVEHISGVHYVAMYIGRQLKNLSLPIDLGRISGAAAGHDIGKYGCVGEELKRVPYLHYYYSDKWFKKYDINYIRNIAINHSTWDLELENLSLESLILIYSDFRVKNMETEKGPVMNIFSLEDSFEIILKKLDNVDSKKEKRYRKVYAKLYDFEQFLIHLGVNTFVYEKSKLPSKILLNKKDKSYALLFGEEITENLKYLSIMHNVNLMYRLRDEYSLDAILEAARSEKNWKNLREYIRVLEEYSTYLTQKQKLQTIKFLYDNLVHPEDDIRRHSASLMGNLIAIFDEEYRKELPSNVVTTPPEITAIGLFKEYVNLLLNPGHKILSGHRFFMQYNLSIFVDSVFQNCSSASALQFRSILLSKYKNPAGLSIDSSLFLIQTADFIRVDSESHELRPLYDFLLTMLSKKNSTLRLYALFVSLNLLKRLPINNDFKSDLKNFLKESQKRSTIPFENEIKAEIFKFLDERELSITFFQFAEQDEVKVPEIFLNNLKTATEWIKKKYQIHYLKYIAQIKPKSYGLHAAIHFCNLLKVSAVESVRSYAGNAVISLMPLLSQPERNEVSVELLRALEIEGNRFTEYIPAYLGRVILYLKPEELNEVIEDLIIKIKTSNEKVKSLLLKTIGISIENYNFYKERFFEDDKSYKSRLIKMLGILLNGLADYKSSVIQSSLSVIGKNIFCSKVLSMEDKTGIYKLIAKKLLTLMKEDKDEELLFLSNSASLNHIYRFISDYSFLKGDINIEVPKKLAFFPGTFDPFSNSHKAIVNAILKQGFEVYLAIDEFSWSKKTLPSLLRKDIVNMSTAEDLNVYIYPDDSPINIANPKDLEKLRKNFRDAEVYMVAGMDVLMNASCYKKEESKNSIHSFPHIIFERGSFKKLEGIKKIIKAPVIILSLPSKYSSISSSEIRKYIDESRDFSSLVSPMVQSYINENGFYQREPQDKTMPKSLYLKSEIVNNINMEYLEKLFDIAHLNKNKHKAFINMFSKMPSARVMLLVDTRENEIVAFSLFHWLRSNNLYAELKNHEVSEYLRDNSTGRMILIDDIYVKSTDKNLNLLCLILTETLCFSIAHDYEYCIYKSATKDLESEALTDYLTLQGFLKVPCVKEDEKLYAVSMSTPCILNLDIENNIKEPFRSNQKIKNEILKARENLLSSLTKLYKGELLLSFDTNMLHQSMIRKICEVNGVSPFVKEELGAAMCVPYGDILDRYVIPNTVTKALHTEKYFSCDMKNFTIGQFPHYMDLSNQVKMLKSFMRPVILVDNLLHKGYRMQALNPIFKEENIEVKTVVAGILSGKGKDLMSMQQRDVNFVYFIPRLKVWFNENSLYPFIGGDAVYRGKYPEKNLVPSINLILPYTSPAFIRGADVSSIYNLSKTCILNSINILKVMEEEYHLIHERNLTLLSLGQIFNTPRCTDPGENMEFNLNLPPSSYLKDDLEKLLRLKNVLGC